MSNTYFQGDRGYWDDPDYKTAEQRLVYAMLWQSRDTDIVGLHTRNDELDARFRCHISLKKFRETLKELEKMDKIQIFDAYIWIKAAIWRNLNKGKCSDNQVRGVLFRLSGVRDTQIVRSIKAYYTHRYGYAKGLGPIVSVKHRVCTESESESETVSESGTETAAPAKAVAPTKAEQTDAETRLAVSDMIVNLSGEIRQTRAGSLAGMFCKLIQDKACHVNFAPDEIVKAARIEIGTARTDKAIGGRFKRMEIYTPSDWSVLAGKVRKGR